MIQAKDIMQKNIISLSPDTKIPSLVISIAWVKTVLSSLPSPNVLPRPGSRKQMKWLAKSTPGMEPLHPCRKISKFIFTGSEDLHKVICESRP